MPGICIADVQTAALRNLLGNRCYSYATIAIGTTKSKIKTTSAVSYSIDGVMYTKAATDDLFVFSDVTVQAAGTTKYYALCLDASGTATVISGTSTAMPDIPSTRCVIGALKMVCGSASFTPATTLLDAANITATYYNLSCIPTAGIPG